MRRFSDKGNLLHNTATTPVQGSTFKSSRLTVQGDAVSVAGRTAVDVVSRRIKAKG
jgi:hypothetical protein